MKEENLTAGEFFGMFLWGMIFLIGFSFLCLAIYLCLGSMPFESSLAIMAIGAATYIIKKARKIPSSTKNSLGSRNLSREISHLLPRL